MIDDDKISSRVNEILIRRLVPDAKINMVPCCIKALELLEQDKEWPELIFLDIELPIMNGWNFLDRLEDRLLCIGNQTKIFMLSGSSDPTDFLEYNRRIYVNGFIQKPLRVDELQKVLNSLSGVKL